MNILFYDEAVTANEVNRLQLWLEELLADEFDKWIKNFHLIRWTEKLSDLTLCDLYEGFKNFKAHRNFVLNHNILPFPINSQQFKELCYGILIQSTNLDRWSRVLLSESYKKTKNNKFSWPKKSRKRDYS